MTGDHIQTALIEHLRKLTSKEKNLADELTAILSLNKNAVYKRLSGATPFTLDDMTKLAQHYRLRWHSIFYPDDPAIFEAEFSGFAAKTSSVEYLQILEQEMDRLRKAGNAQVWNVTIGLPDFYYFYFEELALFQVFVWERMGWNNAAWQERKFSLDMPERTQVVPLSKRLVNHYSQIQTTEIWNEYVLDNLLHQVLYVAESRLFEKAEDLFAVLEKLRLLVRHLEKTSAAGKRFPPEGTPADTAAPFRLLYNETMQNNIFFLVDFGQEKVVYTELDNPNFIRTADPKVVEYITRIFERLEKRAISLGADGEKFRQAYFHKLESRLTYFGKRISEAVNTGNSAQPEW